MSKPKIVIDVTGGIVQYVASNIKDLEVNVIDTDVDGLEDDEPGAKMIQFPNEDKPTLTYAYQGEVDDYDPEFVEDISKQIKA